MHNKTLVSRGVSLALLLSAGAVQAQTAQPAQSTQESDVLEEITVTAQFRSENLQETPLAITAITGDTLEDRSQTSIYEVSRQAPSVFLAPQAQANGSGLIAYIRGVGQTDFNFALEPGVGLYVDDVYYSTLTGSLLDLLDLDRVEILRGPQGTLAGRNSIGGAIKLFSRKAEGHGGNVSLTYGSYNRVDARASGDFTLVEDKLFMRVAGVTKNRDGYVDRIDYGCSHPGSGVPTLRTSDGCKLGTLGGISYTAGRLSMRWVPSDSVEVTFIGDVTNDSSEAGADVLRRAVQTAAPGSQNYVYVDDGNPATPATIPYDCRFVPFGKSRCPGSTENNPYLSYANFIDTRAPTTQRPFKPVVVPPVQQLDQYGLSANLDWAISDDYSLKWISSWRKYDSSWAQDVDNSPAASQQLLQTLSHWQWSQELRLNGSIGEAVDYTVGGFYFKQDGTLEARVDLNYAGIDFVHGPDPTPSTSQALFLQATWHATDALDFTIGGRYTEDEKDYTYYRHNPDGSLPLPPNPAIPPPPPYTTFSPFNPNQPPNAVLAGLNGATGHFESNQFDWRFVMDYQWTDDVMTYLQASTGYKGGGINPRPFYTSQVLSFDPETLTTYEIGLKSDFADNRIRVNLAAFYNEYEDIILRLNVCPQSPPAQQRPCQLPANVGSAEVQGVELESNMLLGAGFSIDLAASWLDFKYTETNLTQTGIPTSFVTPYTPEVKGSLGLQWETDFAGDHSFVTRLDYTYLDQVYGDAFNNPYNHIPHAALANLRLTWRGPGDDNWEAAVEVQNLTDELFYLATNDYSASAGSSSFQPGLPRTWALTVKKNFD